MNRHTNPDIARYAKNQETAAETLRHPHVDWTEKDTASPLHLVAAAGTTPALVKALVEHGADIHLRNAQGYTPLDWAAVYAVSPTMIRALLENGAAIIGSSKNPQQPLHVAASFSRNPEIVTALIKGGADVNACTAYSSTPLLHASVSSTEPEILRTLLRHGADPTLFALTGETALHAAATQSSVEKVRALIEAGAETNATDINGNTPLFLAQTQNFAYPEIAQLMRDILAQRQRPVQRTARTQRRTEPDPARHSHDTSTSPARASVSAAEQREIAEMEATLMTMFADALDSLGGDSMISTELRRAASNIAASPTDTLTQIVERWYGDTVRAAQPAPVRAWCAIENEPHAEELKLIGVSRSMLYNTQAHFSDDDKRTALALIAQRESRGAYVKFIAQWQPWQKQLRRMRPNDFADLDQHVAAEREGLAEQPVYTSDNDYVELYRRMENMQRERLAGAEPTKRPISGSTATNGNRGTEQRGTNGSIPFTR